MSLEIANYSTILIELIKAVKMHNFYPQGHPNLDSALDRCFTLFRKALDEGGEFKWTVDQKGVYCGKLPLAQGSSDSAAFAKKLFYRRVKEMTFTKRLTPKDLRAILVVANTEPEEIQSRGGLEAVCAESGVEGVLLNEMSFEALKKLKAELEEKKAEEKSVAGEKAEKPGEGTAPEEEKKQEPEKAETKEETLEELIEKIGRETDFLRYNDLSVRIKEKTDLLIAGRRFDEAYGVIALFLGHASGGSALQEDLKLIAKERIEGFLTKDVIRYLVARVGRKDETEREAIKGILFHGGEASIETLLDFLVDAPEASTRRNYFNALTPFGNSIIPGVERRLRSPEWYVVRQMVALLGEVEAPEVLDAIEGAYGHPDIRVKKEVLKSLAKKPSERTRAFVLKALEEEDMSLKCQAITSLGAMRDRSAVETLAGIALKREPFADKQDAKKEAIKALGMIGDQSAVEHLKSILFKKVWIGKKANEEIRSLAAASLGMIGGEEAMNALEEVSRNSVGDLYMTCKRILEGREKSQ